MSFSNSQNMVAMSVTGSSTRMQIAATDSIATAPVCRITNTSTTLTIGVTFGGSAVAAAFPANGTAGGSVMHAAVPPLGIMDVDVPKGTTHIAAIGSAAGPTVTYFAFGK